MGPRLSDLTETKCLSGVAFCQLKRYAISTKKNGVVTLAYREKQVRFFRKYESALSASPRLDWM
jgi:hypothetical protein